MTAAPALDAHASSAKGTNVWIISRREDLVWFQGSALAGLLLVALFALAPPLTNATYAPGHPAVIGLLLWGVFFDGTHVFGTYARSYLPPKEKSRALLPNGWSWGLIALGPTIAVVDHATCPQGPSQLGQAGWLFRTFLLFAYLWAYWHLVRQHYGFLVLYRRRAGESSSSRLDAIVLWAGCLYPYVRYSLTNAYVTSGLPQTLPASLLAPLREFLDAGFALAALALAIGFVIRRPKLGPKHAFLAIVIAFHLIVFSALDNLLTITAALTIFHNLQYHRIVWQYERGQGRVPAGGLLRYLALGVLLGSVWYGPRIIGAAIAPNDLVRNALLGFGWGIAFHHYLVDGRIWRVRKHAEVADALDAGARAAVAT